MKNVKIIKKRFKHIEAQTYKKLKNKFKTYSKFFISFLIITFFIYSLTKEKKKREKIEFKYFACFCSTARKENLYVRQLISYYINIGFEKFIFGDNNRPKTEKLSDTMQDYINNGTVDIINIFGSPMSQSEFFGNIYEKYKTQCEWISFFDFDEYLKILPNNYTNITISIKEYLSNPIFSKCESIGINWLIYSDNNLLHYDNRTLIERFTSPNYNDIDNKFVKSIIRGNLNKKIFYPKESSHVPDKRVIICNSMGKRLKYHDKFSVKPPLLKKAFLMHYNTKTVDEYVNKIKRGGNKNAIYDINERIVRFFSHNNFTDEKLKIFEKAFKRKIKYNSSDKIDINIFLILYILLCLFF